MDYAIDAAGSRDISDADVIEVFERSFRTWTEVSCDGRSVGFMVQRREERSSCTTPEFATSGGNSNSMAFVDDWLDRGHAAGAFALTTTWFSTATGEILDADMELNQERFEFARCPEEGCVDGRVDLQDTVTHELGHFFGLAHSPDDREATMWACADEGDVLKRDLAPDDIEGLCAVYPDGSLDAECEFDPRGGFDPRCRIDRGGCSCRAPGTGSAPPLALLLLVGLVLHRRRR